MWAAEASGSERRRETASLGALPNRHPITGAGQHRPEGHDPTCGAHGGTKQMADVKIKHEGFVVLLIPDSKEGRRWIVENLGVEPWQWHGGAAAVEARYAGPIVKGMRDDGLEVVSTTGVVSEEHGITPQQETDLIRRGIVAPPGRRQ